MAVNPSPQITLFLGVGDPITPQTKGIWGQLAQKLQDQANQIQRLRKNTKQKVDTSSGKPVVVDADLPKQVLSASATESPLNTIDHLHSQVSVVFTRDGNDKNFAGVNVFFTGYRGNNNPVLVAQGSDSPLIFTVDSTGETVAVTVVPYNSAFKMAPFAGAKATAVALDGVVSAPPAPSVASTTVALTSGATTLGEQFSFNFLPATLTDRILGYWIYRKTSNTTPTVSDRLQFVPNNPNQSAVYVFSDLSGVSTNYYWVSAVSASGLESALSAAGTAGGGGGGPTITTYRPTSSTAIVGGGYTNPANAYDSSSTTAASAQAVNVTKTVESSWQGIPAASGSPTAISLNINSSVTSGGVLNTSVVLEYSLNNGSTWIQVYQSFSNRSQRTDTIALSTSQNLTQIKVRATMQNAAGSPYTVKSFIYDINVQVTT